MILESTCSLVGRKDASKGRTCTESLESLRIGPYEQRRYCHGFEEGKSHAEDLGGQP